MKSSKHDDLATRVQVSTCFEISYVLFVYRVFFCPRSPIYMYIYPCNNISFTQVVKMLVVVLVTFVVTWLPSILMEIIRYHHKATPPGTFIFLITCEKLTDK